MAYVVTIPRHLAPTVGPSASSAGVFIRTGLTITTGERVASGLISRFAPSTARDNVGCFADRPFPAGGNVISFGGHDVYVATVAPPRYPQQVLRCASPPPGAGASSVPASPCVEVMMADEGSRRGSRGPRWATPQAARHGPAAPPVVRGPTAFSPPFLRKSFVRRPKPRGYLAKSYSRSAGRRTPREKSSPAEIRRGNSLPEGEIDAIVTVIELDIISITIIIIFIIITAVSTAAHRHRCSNLGLILIV
ncbi:hypothetical protein QYE76_058045 [Lolium multiflorum]|uniref:Uncharacterized protein n=1 Tax=Lolium multiflorum TaxID=4521 RepID=A0AAD8T4P9_LOLMU|nr:hypothetical protein QYE76_058045 [Lolium multiflorum]